MMNDLNAILLATIGTGGIKFFALLAMGIAIAAFSYNYNKRFLDWVRFQSLGTRDYVVQKLSSMYISVPQHYLIYGLTGMSVGLGLLVFLLFLPNLWASSIFGVVATIVGWKAPKPIVDFLYRRRIDKFVLQMVDALSLMSNGMKSGLSVAQALGLVVNEMPNPIQQEFNLVLSENRLGVSLEEAFSNLGKRIPSDDVEMFVTSIIILKETGGNLAETFDTITTTIRERIKVEKKIQAMVTQGLYQGIFVMAIPPILAVVFYQSDPEFMTPLFTTPIGLAIILVIIALEVVGFWVILKIIKINV